MFRDAVIVQRRKEIWAGSGLLPGRGLPLLERQLLRLAPAQFLRRGLFEHRPGAFRRPVHGPFQQAGLQRRW